MPILFTFNLQTKLEMSSFIRSRDMAWARNVEMGHVTLTRPLSGMTSVILALISQNFEEITKI